jgi:hypothetical protein
MGDLQKTGGFLAEPFRRCSVQDQVSRTSLRKREKERERGRERGGKTATPQGVSSQGTGAQSYAVLEEEQRQPVMTSESLCTLKYEALAQEGRCTP